MSLWHNSTTRQYYWCQCDIDWKQYDMAILLVSVRHRLEALRHGIIFMSVRHRINTVRHRIGDAQLQQNLYSLSMVNHARSWEFVLELVGLVQTLREGPYMKGHWSHFGDKKRNRKLNHNIGLRDNSNLYCQRIYNIRVLILLQSIWGRDWYLRNIKAIWLRSTFINGRAKKRIRGSRKQKG